MRLRLVSARPKLERFPFTFVHGNRSRLLFGRIFRAAKCATWLENKILFGRIFRAAKCATWLENAPAHHD